jgi:hypothetical protein
MLRRIGPLKIFKLRALAAVFTVLSGCAHVGPSAGAFPVHRHPLFHRSPIAYHRSNSKLIRELARTHPTPICTRSFRHPVLNRCRTWVPRREKPASKNLPAAKTFDDPVGVRLAVAKRARSMLKKPRFKIGSTSYRRDCSGFVLAVYAGEKIPVAKILGADRGRTSVADLYRLADWQGLVHRQKVPAIGDLVFFSNTYDRNRDGQPNDPLTHVGIVERVDPDGTITFVHRVRRGVLRYKLNRFKPHERRDPQSGKVLNHYLKYGRRKRAGKRLTGELFHAFATIVR